MTHTPAQIEDLAGAMWQLLDDLGKNGRQTPCLLAVAMARIAYEPFVDEPSAMADIMTLDYARQIDRECA